MIGFVMWGASDDLLDFDGDVYGEIGCYDRPAYVRVQGEGCGAFFVWRYASTGPGGVWSCEVRQIEEGLPLPVINIKAESRRSGSVGYSPLVHVEGPGLVVHTCAPDSGWPKDHDWEVPR